MPLPAEYLVDEAAIDRAFGEGAGPRDRPNPIAAVLRLDVVEQLPARVRAPGDQRVDVVIGRQVTGADAEKAIGMGEPFEMVGAHMRVDRAILAVERQPVRLPEAGGIEGTQEHDVGVDRKHRRLVDMPRERQATKLLRMPATQRQTEGTEPYLPATGG
ncbi:hypothetical protein D9M70_461550 [compost metagenome]